MSTVNRTVLFFCLVMTRVYALLELWLIWLYYISGEQRRANSVTKPLTRQSAPCLNSERVAFRLYIATRERRRGSRHAFWRQAARRLRGSYYCSPATTVRVSRSVDVVQNVCFTSHPIAFGVCSNVLSDVQPCQTFGGLVCCRFPHARERTARGQTP